MFKRIIVTNIFSIFFVLIITVVAQSAYAVTPSEAKEIKNREILVQQKLQKALKEGIDVSNIIPMMNRVKQLGDQGRIKEIDALLKEILSDFEQIDELNSAGDRQPLNAEGVFHTPRKVNIIGYKHSVMEPFISRDGKFLFFNSEGKTDTPKTDKNIYYAMRIDDTNFEFMGEVKGVNSAAVDGVPSIDNNGNFYYVSAQYYGKDNGYTTVYSGKFNNGLVTDIISHQELSLNIPGWLNMDIEISADGSTLYLTQSYFNDGSAPPEKSYFSVAHLQNGRFVIDKNSDEIFSNINTDYLEYGASISTDELEIYFTRADIDNNAFSSYRATRLNKGAVFSTPIRIKAMTGFSEAPAISNNGQRMYFHKKDENGFNLYVLQREFD